MKGFNRKRIISSLAASAMVAAATLAPLPGLLAPVHAAPAPPYIQINNPAHIDQTLGTGENGINVTLTYNCTGTPTITDMQVGVVQPSGAGATSVIRTLATGQE